ISVADNDNDSSNEIQDLGSVLTEGNDAGGAAIANLADPTAAQDAATKAYVDAVAVPAPSLATGNLIQTENRVYDLNGFDLGFDGSGSIGIGRANPQSKLDVEGQIQARSGFASTEGSVGNPGYGFYTNGDTDTGMFRAAENQLAFSTDGTEAFRINASQNIGIGIATPTERLHVNGNILASGSITPDYVFEKYFDGKSGRNPEYKLYKLEEIESFIRKNHHLPGVPSAKEVSEKGGIVLNRATEINLEKIEELFLHTIEQKRRIDILETDKKTLEKEVSLLKTRLERIERLLIEKSEN
ncbi:hypothetical protein, partial [Robiginitalea aurantiaca]